MKKYFKFFSSKGYAAVRYYRISNLLYKKGHKILAHLVHNISVKSTGADISEAASIGNNFYVPHPVGIVIGGAAHIGKNCSMMSCVTIGATDVVRGGGAIYIGDNVYFGSGAKLVGNFTVGNNVNIGANAVVLDEIPDNCTVVGVPARVIKKEKIQ